MNGPERTDRRDPIIHPLGSLADGPSGYITGMEADGQRQVVHSDVLPADAPWADRGPSHNRYRGDGTLDALGFVKGEPVPGDPLFVRCTLPDGWRKAGSDHAMWSYIVDERGIRRVAVFYKAAWYDRSAHAQIVDVGAAATTEAIYGDGLPRLPHLWDVFTDAERDDFRAGLQAYLQQAEESPTVYRDRLPRVWQLIELANPGT